MTSQQVKQSILKNVVGTLILSVINSESEHYEHRVDLYLVQFSANGFVSFGTSLEPQKKDTSCENGSW